jgi:hypothetical protein
MYHLCLPADRLVLLLATVAFVPGALLAQLTTGAIAGTLRAMDGHPLAGTAILINGGAGFRTVILSNASGEFGVTLPYGQYRFSRDVRHGAAPSGATIFVAPLQTARFDLVTDASGGMHSVQPAASRAPGMRTDATSGRLYPEAFSLQGLLLSREPSSVTEPLDFTGVSDNRLAVESQRGLSWTDTQYKFQGMDATDSYQPGLPAVAPDVQALDEVWYAAPSLRQLRRVMAPRLASFLPSRVYPGMARFRQRTPAPRFLRRTCRRQPAGDWCSRPTNFAGSHEIVWRSADR